MSILGNSVVRREDPAMLTTGGTYVADLDLPGAAVVTFVRATMAHARIEEIDVDEARGAPGVLAVITAAELGLPDEAPSPAFQEAMVRPLLARDVVRFVGEPVVAIVSETETDGVDAAELVIVDYDPLDAVVSPAAARDGEVLLFPEAGTNQVMHVENREGELDWSDCEVSIEAEIVNQRVAPVPIEPRAAAATWEDGRLVTWVSCQGAHPVRDDLVLTYGLEADQVRVIVPDVGGGFGAKAAVYPEIAVLGALSRAVGRPVRWVETRSDSMLGLGHGRGQHQRVRMGGTKDGRVTHYALEVDQEAGAYPMVGAMLPWLTRMMLTGTYHIAHSTFEASAWVTNTTPVVAYRGAGRPEATTAIERAIDLFAVEAGLDPAEVRRRNLVPPDAFPWKNGAGTVYDTGDYEAALDTALEVAGYADLRAEQARRRESGDRRVLGIGTSTYVEITAIGHENEFGACELRPDGSVLVLTGSTPYGQGHHTAWAMLVSDRLGIPMDRIEIRHGDTDLIPYGHLTGGSRSAQISGSALWEAAGGLVDLARGRAAELLEAADDDVVLDVGAGGFHVAGVPARTVSWDDVASQVTSESPLVATVDFSTDAATFPFGAHVSVVEVDLDTGKVDLLRHIAVDDAGTILNPLLADGQVHGGLAQGIAQALYEEVVYDPDGNPLTANLADYGIPAASELPTFERVAKETPTPLNPLGAKGIGESGTIGSTPAVQSAVVDALSHLGVRHIDMPLTPERVWRAIPR